MNKYTVIVESPTKAKTISRFLKGNYTVIASVGHVRDLPSSSKDIPTKNKNLPWTRLGIDVDNDFEPLYIPIKGKEKNIKEIKQALKESSGLILATDEDREGESIAWHLSEILKPKVPIYRMVFHEITKSAIDAALSNFRDLNIDLIRAQETRRKIDRLFGYKVSTLLWKKITYRLSAGRVQSPGLRLLVERERERSLFVKSNYQSITVHVSPTMQSPIILDAEIVQWKEKKVASGGNFDLKGTLDPQYIRIDESLSTTIVDNIVSKPIHIESVEKKTQIHKPPAPYTTSTLQQDSIRRLRLSARETMRIAQSLYEKGYITYMRTDSPSLSEQALNGLRKYIRDTFAPSYLPSQPQRYATKSSSAQEAHEAIRPSGETPVPPEALPIEGLEKSLYELIWKRAIASQMTPMQKELTHIRSRVGDAECVSRGTIIGFDGFTRVLGNTTNELVLPSTIKKDDTFVVQDASIQSHETKPPARYNEASLVKQLELLQIGRPSTYASIINILLERDYAKKVDQSLIPTLRGFAVCQFLERHFHDYIDYNYTAELEKNLDKIAEGTLDHLKYMNTFYFEHDGLRDRVAIGETDILPDVSRKIDIESLDDDIEVRIGQYGPYTIMQDGEKAVHVTIPEDCTPSDINKEYLQNLVKIKKQEQEPLGVDPKTSKNIYVLTGRYGPYVQLGQLTDDGPKPRRTSIPRGIPSEQVTLDMALKFLSIPKVLGVYPKNNQEITALIGRFGPYISCGDLSRSLKKDDNIYELSLERAIELLDTEPRTVQRRSSKKLKTLGIDKKSGKTADLYKGPYGLYIKYGKKNIRLPDELKSEDKIDEINFERIAHLL